MKQVDLKTAQRYKRRFKGSTIKKGLWHYADNKDGTQTLIAPYPCGVYLYNVYNQRIAYINDAVMFLPQLGIVIRGVDK